MATGLTSRPLSPRLEGVAGFRDLGGFPTRDGGTTATGLLFRSPCPSELTAGDRETLAGLRLGARVDLRAAFEIDDAPEVVLPGVPVLRAPVLDAPDAGGYVRALMTALAGRRHAAAVLEALLRLGGAQFARAFAAAAERPPALVHCTTGRDRTGLFAALALRLADVDDALIALDYAEAAANGDGEPLLLALDVLDREWGGAQAYLLAHGLPATALATFRRAFRVS